MDSSQRTSERYCEHSTTQVQTFRLEMDITRHVGEKVEEQSTKRTDLSFVLRTATHAQGEFSAVEVAAKGTVII
jgi:hypothetical protein